MRSDSLIHFIASQYAPSNGVDGTQDILLPRAWELRNPELIAHLAAVAPKLRHLEIPNPKAAPPNVAAALPPELGRLSQLSFLFLYVGRAPVTTAQVI